MNISNIDEHTLVVKPDGKMTKKAINNVFKKFNGSAMFIEGSWEQNFKEFTLLLEVIKEKELKPNIKLDTCTWDEFRLKFGVYQFEKVNSMKFKKCEIPENDIEMLRFIGSVAIDYYLNHTNYNVVYKDGDNYKVSKIDIPK